MIIYRSSVAKWAGNFCSREKMFLLVQVKTSMHKDPQGGCSWYFELPTVDNMMSCLFTVWPDINGAQQEIILIVTGAHINAGRAGGFFSLTAAQMTTLANGGNVPIAGLAVGLQNRSWRETMVILGGCWDIQNTSKTNGTPGFEFEPCDWLPPHPNEEVHYLQDWFSVNLPVSKECRKAVSN